MRLFRLIIGPKPVSCYPADGTEVSDQSVISDPPEEVDPDAHREKACPTYFFNSLLVACHNEATKPEGDRGG